MYTGKKLISILLICPVLFDVLFVVRTYSGTFYFLFPMVEYMYVVKSYIYVRMSWMLCERFWSGMILSFIHEIMIKLCFTLLCVYSYAHSIPLIQRSICCQMWIRLSLGDGEKPWAFVSVFIAAQWKCSAVSGILEEKHSFVSIVMGLWVQWLGQTLIEDRDWHDASTVIVTVRWDNSSDKSMQPLTRNPTAP